MQRLMLVVNLIGKLEAEVGRGPYDQLCCGKSPKATRCQCHIFPSTSLDSEVPGGGANTFQACLRMCGFFLVSPFDPVALFFCLPP